MTEESMPLAELLAKSGGEDFLRSAAEAVLQLLMEADVEGRIGAGRHERSDERLTYRNGFRDRSLHTRLGCCSCASPSCGMAATSRRFWRPEDQREGAGGGDTGSLDRRRLDPARG